MKKILITGGGGFIGYHLTKSLSKNNKIILIDNFERGKNDNFLKKILHKNVKLIKHDLTKPCNINLKNISIVFHLAAKVGVKNVSKSPSKTFETNIQSLMNTINLLKLNSFKGKFIFFSTSEVYSPLIFNRLKKQPIAEIENLVISSLVKNRDSYFLSKIMGEKIVQLSGLKYNILRPHNIYGPRMGNSHVIPELTNKIKNKKTAKVFSPNHKRAFCYIDDAVKQITKITFSNYNKDTFNIGNPKEEISMLDLAKRIRTFLKVKTILKKDKVTLGSPSRRVPNLKKFNKKFNPIKYKDLNFGLKETISWYIKNEKN